MVYYQFSPLWLGVAITMFLYCYRFSALWLGVAITVFLYR